MEKFEYTEGEILERDQLIKEIQDYGGVENMNTMAHLVEWLSEQTKKAGYNTPKKFSPYFDFKKAELFFDAGFKGEAITELENGLKSARELNEEEFFKDISKGLQREIDAM